jgi:hypothetical protein
VTLDPDLKDEVSDWALTLMQQEASADKTFAPESLIDLVVKLAPEAGERISAFCLTTAESYLDKGFLLSYATAAGSSHASALVPAANVLKSAAILLPVRERADLIRSSLNKATQWDPALARNDDVAWLLRVGTYEGAAALPGVRTYLSEFATGKHAEDAKRRLAEFQMASGPYRIWSGSTRDQVLEALKGSERLVPNADVRSVCIERVASLEGQDTESYPLFELSYPPSNTIFLRVELPCSGSGLMAFGPFGSARAAEAFVPQGVGGVLYDWVGNLRTLNSASDLQ